MAEADGRMRNEIDLQEAYVRLKALRRNLPDAVVLEQHWVTDFHALVEMLANLAGADPQGLCGTRQRDRPRFSADVREEIRSSKDGRPAGVVSSSVMLIRSLRSGSLLYDWSMSSGLRDE